MVAIANTDKRYGEVSITLHWLSFVLVAALFAVGLYMVDLTYYDPLYHELPEWHKLGGSLLFVLTLVRICWVMLSRPPPMQIDQAWQMRAALTTHKLLYLALLLLPLTGYLIATAEGSALSAFSISLLPSFIELKPEQADLAGLVHFWSAWSLVALVVLHALAAFKHHFFDRDNTLIRILSPK